jgi:hypothetical protein
MADESQLKILKQGVAAWNEWRRNNERTDIDLSRADGAIVIEANQATVAKAALDINWGIVADLGGADLNGADLSRADLSWGDFSSADLSKTNLSRADLSRANLGGANLSGANLGRADLSEADLSGANLSRTDLSWANLNRVNFSGANFSGARFQGTIFSDLDLSGCKDDLEICVHGGPSPIDLRTLQRSGPLPLVFLRGVGLPDNLIEYLPSLLSQSIQLYSCFISYSSRDEEFVRRLHADLQDKGVRCWFAPEDMKIGAKILDTLDQAIRLRDKILLVLSEAAIASDWVEDEVTKGFAEERQRGMTVLFPVRLDDAVFTTSEAWALKLRDNRNIGDFRHWKDHDAYQKTLARLLRDLRVEPT